MFIEINWQFIWVAMGGPTVFINDIPYRAYLFSVLNCARVFDFFREAKIYYIFIYTNSNYEALGGGTFFEFFETLDQLDFRVNEVLTQDDKEDDYKIKIDFAGEIKKEFTYSPAQKVEFYKRDK